MVKLRTNSPICLRIVLAFLEFLSNVQVAPGMETESLENIVQSLKRIFKINESMFEVETPKVSLVSLFSSSSPETNEQNGEAASEASTSTSAPPAIPTSSNNSRGTAFQYVSLVELFQEFYMAVAKYGFYEFIFRHNYHNRRTRANQIFKDAIMVLRKARCQTLNLKNIGEALRLLGNKAMRDTCYYEAVEFYSCAIAMCQNNAIYYCNRAAALVKINKLYEAIIDCQKAIKINPRYLNAYYRLGSAYYDQGKYLESICEGFIKVLQLDPKKYAAVVNIQLAEGKLRDQLAWMEEQLEILRNNGVIPMPSHPPARQSTVLAFRGPEEGDTSASGPWQLVEETGDTKEEDTISIADFLDTFARYTIPPE